MSSLSGVWKLRHGASTSGSRTLGDSDTLSNPRVSQVTAHQPPFSRPQARIPIGPPHPTSRFFMSTEQLLVKKHIDQDSLVIDEVDCYEFEEYKEYCLLGCFGGRFPGKRGVAQLVSVWPHRCRVFYRPNGFMLFQFQKPEERDAILNGADQYVHGKKLFLKLSPEDGSLTISDFCIKPVWATFPDLPRPLWHPSALSSITSMLGDPICMDPATLQRKQRAQARTLIYIDTSAPPRDVIPISWNKGGKLDQKVTYENWRDFCTYCNHNGHYADTCPRKEGPPGKNPQEAKEMEGEPSSEARGGNQDSVMKKMASSAENPVQEDGGEPSRLGKLPVGGAAERDSDHNPHARLDNYDDPPDAILSASSSPLAFGTLDAPKHLNGENTEPEHLQDFSPEDFAEVHKQLDIIHGNLRVTRMTL